MRREKQGREGYIRFQAGKHKGAKGSGKKDRVDTAVAEPTYYGKPMTKGEGTRSWPSSGSGTWTAVAESVQEPNSNWSSPWSNWSSSASSFSNSGSWQR